MMIGRMGRFSKHSPTTISSHGIKPDRESLWITNIGQVLQRSEENFLRSILCVFWMSADLHAEGIDRVLQQADGFFDSFRSIESQEIGCLSQFWAHCWNSQRCVQYSLLQCPLSQQSCVRRLSGPQRERGSWLGTSW